MKKSVAIFVCLAFIGCNTMRIDIWERTKETEMKPLGYFIMMRDDSIRLRIIIKEGEEVINQRDEIGNSLSHIAAYYNAVRCARLLISEEAEFDKPNPFGETPLMRACGEGNFDIVTLLGEAGANVNAYSKVGNTPIIFAIIGCCGKDSIVNEPGEKIISYLIKKGANVNFKGGELENTALGMAQYFEAHNIERLLIGYGAME
jgi:ankyrin repeat protein